MSDRANHHGQQLIDALVSAARRPAAQARAAPPAIYADPAMLAEEQQCIFEAEWICVARERDLPASGDYRCFELAGEPLVLLRDASGELRAFSNICRHRGARLLHDTGTTRRIVCPYHAWAYELDGRCSATPFMDGVTAQLPAFHVECWQGWVYVTLAEAPAPLSPRLVAVTQRFANYQLDQYAPLVRESEVWQTNWKLLIENFVDPYHLFRVHAKTVEPALPTRNTEPWPGGPGHTWFVQRRNAGVPYEYAHELQPANPRLSEEEHRSVPIVCVFPTHLVSISPDRLFWITLQPRGTDEVQVLWGLDVYPPAFPAGADGDKLAAELTVRFQRINEEDKGILRHLQRNASSRYNPGGPLCGYERTVWEFHRYLARRLSPGCEAHFE